MRRVATIALPFFLLLAAAATAAAVTVELEGAHPVRGEAITVRLSEAEGAGPFVLEATYRPNSQTERTERAGVFDERGALSWTPRDAGITRLRALAPDGAELWSGNTAVWYPSPPKSGILIFLFAGLLLFGGAGLSMRRALEPDRD
ncbi:MAG: hypothetical protein JW958_03715 [Candidatus Eisenbacteria bacterium]|nr:hypothetical protein [Candidatus Eisenbacteria bacterium]